MRPDLCPSVKHYIEQLAAQMDIKPRLAFIDSQIAALNSTATDFPEERTNLQRVIDQLSHYKQQTIADHAALLARVDARQARR